MAITSFPHVPSINAVADFGKLAEGGDVDTSKQQNQHTTNCLSYAAGARVLFATDEWFASAHQLLQDTQEPVFDPHAFGLHGKVMDGWESRRRRQPGHDWCLVQCPQRVRIPLRGSSSAVIHVDTAYFTGNYAPAVSLVGYDLSRAQAAQLVAQVPHALERLVQPSTSMQGTCATRDDTQQVEELLEAFATTAVTLLPPTPLSPGYEESRHHVFAVDSDDRGDGEPTDTTAAEVYITHVRIQMHPDGGMARLRLEGAIPAPHPADAPVSVLPLVDLPYRVPHGGPTLPSTRLRATTKLQEVSCGPGCAGVDASDSHYGHPNNLLQASMGTDMGDGWETARHTTRPRSLVVSDTTGLVDFGGLHDWCILSLGEENVATAATSTTNRRKIHSIVVDTQHFRGNYPESIWIEGRQSADGDDDWNTIVPRSRLGPDAEHLFTIPPAAQQSGMPSQLRLTIYPDGGLSRVRVFATADE